MRRFVLCLVAALAAALPASAVAAVPPPDKFVPPPDAIQTVQGGTRIVQLDDGAGGMPYLGVAHPYNAGDWENTLREFHDNGTYDRELTQIDNLAERWMLRSVRHAGGHNRHAKASHRGGHGKGHAYGTKKPALVLDIDETSLSNYTAINADNFTFGKNSQNEATDEIGVAIAPTLKLFNDAKQAGVTVFFITGRPEAQRAPTEDNLRKQGYAGWAKLYLKPAGTTLSTVQYKTASRADIESQGYRIVANVGDQFSDLVGGHAERGFKLPNPFYFLP